MASTRATFCFGSTGKSGARGVVSVVDEERAGDERGTERDSFCFTGTGKAIGAEEAGAAAGSGCLEATVLEEVDDAAEGAEEAKEEVEEEGAAAEGEEEADGCFVVAAALEGEGEAACWRSLRISSCASLLLGSICNTASKSMAVRADRNKRSRKIDTRTHTHTHINQYPYLPRQQRSSFVAVSHDHVWHRPSRTCCQAKELWCNPFLRPSICT